MFSRMRISAKLGLLIASMAVAMVFIGLAAVYAMRLTQVRNAENVTMARDVREAVGAARGAEVQFKNQVLEYKNVLLRGHDREAREKHLAAFHERKDAVTTELFTTQLRMGRLGLPMQAVEETQKLHGQ